MTKPSVFIIESTGAGDERDGRHEGSVLKEMLALTRRGVQYRYIRTIKELEWCAQAFRDSDFRYLHLSCHGTGEGLSFTLETAAFAELAEILGPCLNGRRLFISACDGARKKLASPILRGSTCYSVASTDGNVSWDRAAISWAAFYSLANQDKMTAHEISHNLDSVGKLFRVRFRIYKNIAGHVKRENVGCAQSDRSAAHRP